MVEPPEDKPIVNCKWVYQVKEKPNGKVEKYKARLVAKGYTHTAEIDYEETFSPVAKLNTMRTVIAIVAQQGCRVDKKSTSGYCFCFGSTLITWSSKKQHTVALSSTEA